MEVPGQLLLCRQPTRHQHKAALSSGCRLQKEAVGNGYVTPTGPLLPYALTGALLSLLLLAYCCRLLLPACCRPPTAWFAGLNYFQSVTPNLSAGAEVFFLPQQMRSGVGLCLRHQGEKHIAAMQLATTGILSAQYAHRVTDKVGVCVCWHMG